MILPVRHCAIAAAGSDSSLTRIICHDHAAAAGALQQERAARLLAESKLQEERRRRIFVEKLLADVCRDLDNKDSVVPAAMEALMKLAELTDAAMLAD